MAHISPVSAGHLLVGRAGAVRHLSGRVLSTGIWTDHVCKMSTWNNHKTEGIQGAGKVWRCVQELLQRMSGIYDYLLV